MIVKLKSRIVRMTLGRVIMHFIIKNWFINTTKCDLMIVLVTIELSLSCQKLVCYIHFQLASVLFDIF